MIVLEKVKKGINEPHKIVREIHRAVGKYLKSHRGIRVMDEDWDNLIILDACRYDEFVSQYPHDGNLRAVQSPASATPSWLSKNFEDRQFPDTIYISGNPNLANINSRFFEIAQLWETDWDDELNTAHPEAVANRAVEIAQNHPCKRLIIHFVQPHVPFIGEKGRKLEQSGFTGGGVIRNERESEPVYSQLANGKISAERVREAYVENLKLTFPHIERLVTNLAGRTVITSDHGESFGEWGIYGHPDGVFIDCLVTVPWMVHEDGPRKKIEPGEETVSTEESAENIVNSRLKDLGYV